MFSQFGRQGLLCETIKCGSSSTNILMTGRRKNIQKEEGKTQFFIQHTKDWQMFVT